VRQQALDDDVLGFFSILIIIVLVLELVAAISIRGIVFSAALFSLMSVIFGIATFVSYVLNRRAAKRAESNTRRRTAVGYLLLIALVSSACIALLAGIFSLPLLFHGGSRELHPQWRMPADPGSSRTDQGPLSMACMRTL